MLELRSKQDEIVTRPFLLQMTGRLMEIQIPRVHSPLRDGDPELRIRSFLIPSILIRTKHNRQVPSSSQAEFQVDRSVAIRNSRLGHKPAAVPRRPVTLLINRVRPHPTGLRHTRPMKLVDLKEVLRAGAIEPSHRLGQNFLHDAHYLTRIAALGEVSRGDRVLEIGPGTGALTTVMLDLGAQVLAIEKDRRLAAYLRSHYAGQPLLELIADDALEYLRESSTDWSQWKVVANLPYSVASPILVELASKPFPPALVAVTIQLEVANRIRARSGGHEFGLLSLLIQARFEVGECLKIPAGCFFPVPEVESACLVLIRRASPLLTASELDMFRRIARRGFSQRRKMMGKLLKQEWPAEAVDNALLGVGLTAQVRAEAVTLEQFAELARILNKV